MLAMCFNCVLNLISLVSLLQIRRSVVPKMYDPAKYPEKILFCGWRRDIDDMIMVRMKVLFLSLEN